MAAESFATGGGFTAMNNLIAVISDLDKKSIGLVDLGNPRRSNVIKERTAWALHLMSETFPIDRIRSGSIVVLGQGRVGGTRSHNFLSLVQVESARSTIKEAIKLSYPKGSYSLAASGPTREEFYDATLGYIVGFNIGHWVKTDIAALGVDTKGSLLVLTDKQTKPILKEAEAKSVYWLQNKTFTTVYPEILSNTNKNGLQPYVYSPIYKNV